MFKCKECKSINIELKAWINPNEGLITGYLELIEEDEGYCSDCEEQREIIWEED
jgi:hypothetical protein